MLWTFAGETTRFVLRRSHREAARRDDDHLGTVLGAFTKACPRLERPFDLGSEHVRVNVRYPVRIHISVPIQLLRYERLVDPGNQSKDTSAHQNSETSQQPRDTPLLLCRRLLSLAYHLELRALLPEPSGLGLLTSRDEGALCVGDLGRPRLARGHPCLRRVDVIAAQE